ncbi:FAD-dependent oxidoreductase [Streptomyces sp. NPDC055254]
MPRGEPRRVARTAVVVGAGMGGLCAARVLSERFDQVVVIDEDPLAHGSAWRPGVPQGRQPHLLLRPGARLLEEWFPGITGELYDGGAIELDLCRDVHRHRGGGVLARPASGLRVPVMSRPFLEATVRGRLAGLGHVSVRGRSRAHGLVTDASGTRITGVRLAGGATLECALVVDATGSGARSLSWLADLGYGAPPLSAVGVDIHYASRVYRRDEAGAAARDWKAAVVTGAPSLRRWAMALPQEGARWIVGLVGVNGEVPPADEDGRLAFARSLDSPVVADLMAGSEPLTEPVADRFPENRRRHVERLRRFPSGWVLLGDAVAELDPVHGQGMTSAARQAVVLGDCLDHTGTIGHAFGRRYFDAVARTVAAPWSLAVGGDFAYAGTTGPKPAGTDLFNRYLERVARAARHDDAVSIRFGEVAGLVRRPEWLLAPAFVLRVLRSSRREA